MHLSQREGGKIPFFMRISCKGVFAKLLRNEREIDVFGETCSDARFFTFQVFYSPLDNSLAVTMTIEIFPCRSEVDKICSFGLTSPTFDKCCFYTQLFWPSVAFSKQYSQATQGDKPLWPSVSHTAISIVHTTYSTWQWAETRIIDIPSLSPQQQATLAAGTKPGLTKLATQSHGIAWGGSAQ